ncbi:phosphotransferase [Ophiocordyceps camponoti-floridani]|uniref:Phosphotransferase n=1 Tax=Ophiocordyceps camponoti-floridani TaxID=2030778 RepID=A0A8H4VCG0_9HYPO|nr:phosphotransferase [Ophiocordyceps camponoti-floridani]
MLSWLSLKLTSLTTLQTLWAGYGHICAIEALPSDSPTNEPPRRLILKLVRPPTTSTLDQGHVRKMLSYRVEQYWYDELAPKLDTDTPVARSLVSTRSMRHLAIRDGISDVIATIMTDLRVRFPLVVTAPRSSLSPTQVHAAIDWLSRFHASSDRWLPRDGSVLVDPPLQFTGDNDDDVKGPWRNGGYTYLATRRSEYAALTADDTSEWSRALCRASADGHPPLAEQAASFLTPRGDRRHETCLHGDVKSENMLTTASGTAVAMVDFQYVGPGLGVCDLAKLFSCSVPLWMLTDEAVLPGAELSMGHGERALLDRYRAGLDQGYDWDSLQRHWETALVDWCRFQASWGFWGNDGWLQARVRRIVRDGGWRDWLLRSLYNA